MKKTIIFLQLILISLVVFGQDVAPLNPDFVKYLHEKDFIEKKKKATKTSNYPKGEIPSPVIPNFDNFKPSKKTKGSLPSSYDLRTIEGGKYLTPVKDQGSEGACWSFATYGTIESYWKKQGLSEYDLSEQNLATCHGFDYSTNEGGNFYMSAAYLTRNSGPVSEAEDPYTLPSNAYCKGEFTPVAYVGEMRFLPGRNDDAYDKDIIKQAIMDYGALYMNYYADDDYMNYSDYTYYYDGDTITNHAVTLVGWDDNKVVTGGVASPSSQGAWIVKNSWGALWGDDGYLYISYEDAKALTNVVYFPGYIKYKKNASVYSYDKLGWVTSASGKFGLVKYTAENDLEIKKISTYIPNAGTIIDIEVYNGFIGNSLSGLLGSIPDTNCQLPGYYMFELSEPVKIKKGSDYFIKVKYNSDGIYSIPVEMQVSGYSSGTVIQSGKCWVSPDGSEWESVGSGRTNELNLCIKAYVENESPRLYVKQNGTGSGVSWADASGDLQAMINTLSTTGGEIWVAEGTYTPIRPANNLTTIDYYNRNNAFVLAPDVKIYGGFKGAETALEQRNWETNQTILSGLLSAIDTAYHVVISSDEVGEACLDGFTITGGSANGEGYITVNNYYVHAPQGAGVYLVLSSPLLVNLNVVNNKSAFGGGFYIHSSMSKIENVSILKNNASSTGGGIYNYGSAPTLTNVEFIENTANDGAGMYNENNSALPTLTNVLFQKNTASNIAGGMFNYEGSSPKLTNVTFRKNRGENYGGGMANIKYSSPELNNCIFQENMSSSGGGIYNENQTAPILSEVKFIENSAGFGGGIMNNASSVEITNSKFTDNEVATSGGAIYNGNGSNIMANSTTFTGNMGSYGGAIFSDLSDMYLEKVTMDVNSATLGGGGIFHQNNSELILINSILRNNTAGENGGAVFSHNDGNSTSLPGIFINTLFEKNKAIDKGGAFFYDDGEALPLFFTNCTFAGNEADSGNVFFYVKDGTGMVPNFINCIIDKGENIEGNLVDGSHEYTGLSELLFKNTLTSYSFLGNNSGNTANIENTDPLFADVSNNDYRLKRTSPAREIGDTSPDLLYYLPVTEDLDGNPRIVNGKIDLGAYQYIVSDDASLVSITVDGVSATLKAESEDTYEITIAYTESIEIDAVATHELAIINEDDLGQKAVTTGKNTFTITVTAESGDVDIYTLEVQVRTQKKNQTIVFAPFDTKAVGDPDFSPVAVSSSGLELTYTSSDSEVASIVGSRIHIVGTGSTIITATQEGNDEYNAAEPQMQILTVTSNVSIPDVSTNDVSISPNPTTGKVQVTSSKVQVGKVEIFDINGKRLSTININTKHSTQEVDLSGFANGVYILRINDEQTVKVIKE
ncbi:lectin like domain-containing protein [Bacteroidales bacterium OttesenSCG-928-C19]|nr:lectin like domain-containing protein [Bacteroidales bacterium OttesenSCG-928-C19]